MSARVFGIAPPECQRETSDLFRSGHTSPMPSFFIFTLGCKVNQYESQAVREAWRERGWTELSGPESAEYILVNSCAVTQKAVADVRNAVRRLHRAAPKAAIILSGCAAEAMPRELANLPGMAMLVPQSEKIRLLALPEHDPLFSEYGPDLPYYSDQSSSGKALSRPSLSACPSEHNPRMRERPYILPSARTAVGSGHGSGFPAFHIRGYARSRAVVKIQDGCSHGCTYCIVPATRGPARTRPLADTLAEVARLLEAGFCEIVISGVNLRQYKEGGRDFWDFITALEARFGEEWSGRARFRISSLEPGQLHGRALDILSRSRLVAPQVHLSLQSGSPSVLERMGRGHYRPEEITAFLASLKALWPVFGLGADIIGGFPGETEAEHLETRSLLKTLPLSYAHVFPYSARPGTEAAAMPGQVAPEVKKQRAAELRSLAAQGKKAFLRQMLSLESMYVALEGSGPGTGTDAGIIAEASGLASELPHGHNEFYAECVFDPAEALPEEGLSGLVAACPVRVEKGRLLVRACQGARHW